MPAFRCSSLVVALVVAATSLVAPALPRAAAAERLHYATTQPDAIPEEPSARPLVAPFPLGDTFTLHSRPGAQRVIYLDFNGETIANTGWNQEFNNGNTFTQGPFDTDGNPGSFSNTELETIQGVWQRVAEDYAPYQIDVTTQDPGAAAITRSGSGDTVFGTRALITSSDAPVKTKCGCAGVAWVGAFDEPDDHAFYQPALVFPNGSGTTDKGIAEATTHEVGHNLGLNHDGTSSAGYYSGHGAWAPIMGVGYYHPLSQFSKGEYSGASQTQDDFAVMQNTGAPPVVDDHSNTTSGATALGSGSTYSGSGVIATDADVDVFALTVAAGQLTLNANPAPRGPNLDIKLELLDASGAVVASDDPPSAQPSSSNRDGVTGISAALTRTVTAGTYYARVQGVGYGNPATNGYSGYGSVGAFTLTGSTGAAPTPTLSINDRSIAESNSGTSTLGFTVSLSQAQASNVTVQVATADGTATAGSDYTAASGTVTIPAGQTSATFNVGVTGDTVVEPNETFTVQLSSPSSGVTIGDASGTGTITNDDSGGGSGVSISIADVSKAEGPGGVTTSFTFVVKLSKAATSNVTITAATVNGSAAAGSDYTAKTQTFTFSPGQLTKKFVVKVKGDRTKEANETFFVTLSKASGATIADGQAVGTITNDD